MGMCRKIHSQITVRMNLQMRSKYLNLMRTFGMVMLACVCVCIFMTGKVYAAQTKEKIQEQIANARNKGKVYAVIQDGSGDFTTIQDGVDAAKSGDTLLIYPGVYEENVEICNKTVNLLGIDKESCILQYASTQYNAIPLTFGAGYVANLTIYGYDDRKEERVQGTITTVYDDADIVSIRERQKNFSGYALHIDEDYTYGKEAYIENCRIISNNNHCIGIGCRGNSRITFDHCELISKGNGGCIFFHNTKQEELSGDAYFLMKDCELKNYISPYVISMYCMGEENPVYLTFQNVRTSTVVYEDKSAYNVTNMNQWFDVDEIIALNESSMLEPAGYYSSIHQNLIMYYDKEKSYEYINSLTDEVIQMDKEVALSEGITYLSAGSEEAQSGEEEDVSQMQAGKRYIIDIFNASEVVGDGWCGLDYIYLTPDSFGNTLIEMNYPIVQ